MKKIQGHNCELIFDEPEYEIAKQYKWYIDSRRNTYAKIAGKKISTSKIIFNIPNGYVTWFANGNQCDFRQENIKIITRNEQARLRIHGKKSKFHNVCYNPQNNSWFVGVKKEKVIYGGSYKTEEDAAIAADYYNFTIYQNMEEMNFKWKSDDELKAAFEELQNKYGSNMSERITISHQGVIQKKAKPKSSKYVGVMKCKGGNRIKEWTAEIKKDRKRYSLGYHMTEEEAARAYDEKAKELYGENAKLNFPE